MQIRLLDFFSGFVYLDPVEGMRKMFGLSIHLPFSYKRATSSFMKDISLLFFLVLPK